MAINDLGNHVIVLEVFDVVIKPFLTAAVPLACRIDDHHALKNLGGTLNFMNGDCGLKTNHADGEHRAILM